MPIETYVVLNDEDTFSDLAGSYVVRFDVSKLNPDSVDSFESENGLKHVVRDPKSEKYSIEALMDLYDHLSNNGEATMDPKGWDLFRKVLQNDVESTKS